MAYSFTFTSGRRAHGFNYTIAVPDGFNYAEDVDDRDFIMWHDDGSHPDYDAATLDDCELALYSGNQSLRSTMAHPLCPEAQREMMLLSSQFTTRLLGGDESCLVDLTFGEEKLPAILSDAPRDHGFQLKFPVLPDVQQFITLVPHDDTVKAELTPEALQALLDTIELDTPYAGFPLDAPQLTGMKLEDAKAVSKVLYNIMVKSQLVLSQLQYSLNKGYDMSELPARKHDIEVQLNTIVEGAAALMKKISKSNADNPLLLTLYKEMPNALQPCMGLTLTLKSNNAIAGIETTMEIQPRYTCNEDVLTLMRTSEVKALLAAGVTAPPLDENEDDGGDEPAEKDITTATPQADSTPAPADEDEEDDDLDEDDDEDEDKVEDNAAPAAPVTADEVAKTLSDASALLVRSYLSLAEASLSADNNVDAENYIDKVIEKDPTSSHAWFLKGKAAVWQSSRLRNRIKEGFDAWGNAMQYADEAEKATLTAQIKDEASNVLPCLLSLYCENFQNHPGKDAARSLLLQPSFILSDARRLKEKTSVDVCTPTFRTQMARKLNNCVVAVSDEADKEFGTEESEMTKSAWEQHTQVSDACMDLLEKAYDLSSEDSLCLQICKNAVLIENNTRSSCCYTYYDGYYVKDYTFTDEALALRSNIIQKWTDRQDLHDADAKKASYGQVLAACTDKRSQLRRVTAYEQYWADHADEKTALEAERSRITAERADIKEKIDTGVFLKESHDLDDQITNSQLALEKLGFFKMREKRELEAKIEDLKKQREAATVKGFETERSFIDRNKEIDARLKAIEVEFATPRGELDPAPKATLTPFDGHTTPLQLADYLRTVLPEGCGVQGEGEDAFINLTKKEEEECNRLIVGDDETPEPYVEDPNEVKKYAVLLLDSHNATSVEVRFESKGLAQPIVDSLELALVAKFDPETVTDYIRMAESILQGICPSLDLAALAAVLADCAYQTQEEEQLTADGLELTAEHPMKGELTLTVTEEE